MGITLRFITDTTTSTAQYRRCFADAVVFTQSGALLLQRRPANRGASASKLTLFGGHVEAGESALAAVGRELGEELGARVDPADVTCLGVIEEHDSEGIDVVFVHIWHDRHNTITGCYEGSSEVFSDIDAALDDATLMDYARMALQEAKKKM